MSESVTGYIDHIVFRNEDNGYTVLLLKGVEGQEQLTCLAAFPVISHGATIEADGSLFFGGTIYDAVEELEAMGAAAVGCNCSIGPDQLEAVISGIRKRVSIPVIAKPNAGMPVISETGEAVYHMGPSEFARHMAVLRRAGASILGGCCGTTPEFIRELKKALA